MTKRLYEEMRAALQLWLDYQAAVDAGKFSMEAYTKAMDATCVVVAKAEQIYKETV